MLSSTGLIWGRLAYSKVLQAKYGGRLAYSKVLQVKYRGG